jgi:hypothetical protein
MTNYILRLSKEDKVVMDKTVSVVSSDKSDKIKVDNLHPTTTEFESDALKAREAEMDKSGNTPLPLFRFEEKYKKILINFISQILDIIKVTLETKKAKYLDIIRFIDIIEGKDIEYLIDLTISRNKDTFNTVKQNIKLELITCFYEKRLRVKHNIPENEIIDSKKYPELDNELISIKEKFKELYEEIISNINMKPKEIEKDIEIKIIPSEGGDDWGAGFAVIIEYIKNIDWSNFERGKENYSLLLPILDEEFRNSLKEQNSINVLGSEAIADDMTEDTEEEEGTLEESPDEEVSDEEAAPEDDLSLDEGGDDGMGDLEGADDGFGGEEGGDEGGGDDDSSVGSSEPEEKEKPGIHPFAEINGKEKISIEFQELINQIDRVLKAMEKFEANVAVDRLVELRAIVADALKIAYTQPIEESLFRYTLYVKRFDELVLELKRTFKKSS